MLIHPKPKFSYRSFKNLDFFDFFFPLIFFSPILLKFFLLSLFYHTCFNHMDDPATQHDDDDFQEIIFLGERKRAKLTPSTEPEPELTTRCSICSTYWSNSGPHRIITLKCGHAFGEK